VADLPDAQREILVRAYGGTPSCDEIAARTGKPAGAVKTLVRLGMNRLAEAAEEDEVEARSRD
jgi:RNA polymerase sigma-70 factor (ECF subfamily)